LKLSKNTYAVSEYVANWDRVKKYSNNFYGIIYNIPHSSNKLSDSFCSFRTEMGFENDDILIASSSRITKEKGYEHLLKVIGKYAENSKIKFIIIGDGEYLKSLREYVETNNIAKQVFLLGYRENVPGILAECDIFVLLSFHETLCNSIIEAGMESLPTVAYCVGGIPEIIEHGVNGYLAELKDIDSIDEYINTLLNNKELRIEMGKFAKRIINEKFEEKSIIDKIDNLYRSVLNESI